MEVARYFDKTAKSFHALYNKNGVEALINNTFRRGLYERVDLTVRELDELQSPVVLDVGCGSARNGVIFLNHGAERVVGIDFAPGMLELARDTVKRHGVAERSEFIQGDFLEFEPKERYDASVALGVFDYVADPGPFLKKMADVTDGKVIGSFPGSDRVRSSFRKIRYNMRGCPLFFYTREKLEALCKEAGFERYRIIPYASSGFLLVGYTSA